jgi:hypothetical protein
MASAKENVMQNQKKSSSTDAAPVAAQGPIVTTVTRDDSDDDNDDVDDTAALHENKDQSYNTETDDLNLQELVEEIRNGGGSAGGAAMNVPLMSPTPIKPPSANAVACEEEEKKDGQEQRQHRQPHQYRNALLPPVTPYNSSRGRMLSPQRHYPNSFLSRPLISSPHGSSSPPLIRPQHSRSNDDAQPINPAAATAVGAPPASNTMAASRPYQEAQERQHGDEMAENEHHRSTGDVAADVQDPVDMNMTPTADDILQPDLSFSTTQTDGYISSTSATSYSMGEEEIAPELNMATATSQSVASTNTSCSFVSKENSRTYLEQVAAATAALVAPTPVYASASATAPSSPKTKNVSMNKSFGSAAARNMTPMMRMRLSEGHEEESQMELSPRGNKNMTEEEIKIQKQRRWKEKKKMVDANRKKERQMLDAGHRSSSENKNKNPKPRRGRNNKSRVGRNSNNNNRNNKKYSTRSVVTEDGSTMTIPTSSCQSSLRVMWQNLIETQCGIMPDAASDDESEDEDEEEEGYSTQESTEESEYTDDFTRSEQGERDGLSSLSTARTPTSPTTNAVVTEVKRSSTARTGQRQLQQQQQQQQQNDVATSTVTGTQTVATAATSPSSLAPSIKDKSFIREFITTITTTGMQLLRHRQSRGETQMVQPNEVTAFLRPGIEGPSSGIYTEPHLEFLAQDGIALSSVLLFDIRFFEVASPLQTHPYPTAVPGNSVLLRTTQSEYVFEGRNEEEILRLIHGMRWLIARLSFNLIVGNINGGCELLDVAGSSSSFHRGTTVNTGTNTATSSSTVTTATMTGDLEAQRTRAMNDVTNHLVDKSALFVST